MPHSQTRSEPEGLLMLRLSKVLSSPMRVRILAECTIEEMSPRSFLDAFGGPSLDDVSQDFEVLEQFGWIDRVSSEADASPGRFDRLYTATEPLVLESWSKISDSARALVIGRLIDSLSVRVQDAIAAGTIFERVDSHLTWTPLRLDQQGWDAVIARVDALFYSLFEEQEAASLRMAESGEEPVSTTVGLLTFESPRRMT